MKEAEINRGLRRFLRRLVPKLMQWLFAMRFVGEDRVPLRGPALVVANHSSYLDIPAIFWKFPSWVYFVAKKELFEGPVGFVYRWWKAIPIDRGKPSLSSVRTIMKQLRSGGLVGIFPQGRRVDNHPEAPRVRARTGVVHFAEKLKVPIVPMAIRGRFRFRGGVTVICGEPFFMRLEDSLAENRQSARRKADLLTNYIYELRDSEKLPKLPPELALLPAELSADQRRLLKEMYGQGESHERDIS